MTTIPTADEFTTEWGDGVEPFPFVEDENCNITGFGHQDKAKFAAEINRYDRVCSGGAVVELDDDEWEADHIGHTWVVLGDDGESLKRAEESAPGAFPVTELWGQR
jgi:hypothetical protein